MDMSMDVEHPLLGLATVTFFVITFLEVDDCIGFVERYMSHDDLVLRENLPVPNIRTDGCEKFDVIMVAYENSLLTMEAVPNLSD